MRDYKIGDWVALIEDDSEVIWYGKIVRIIGEKKSYHSYDDRRFECLPDFEFGEDGDPPETFSIGAKDVDDELTKKNE